MNKSKIKNHRQEEKINVVLKLRNNSSSCPTKVETNIFKINYRRYFKNENSKY